MKVIYEEYFGGEIKNTQNKKVSRQLNRWQYRVLQDLHDKNPSQITPTSLEGRLFSPNYQPIVKEDEGTININKKSPFQEDIEIFIAEMKKDGFLDNTGKPLFDRQFKIRKLIRFPKLSGPKGAFIEITKKCLLNCITCYNEFTRAESKKEMTTEKMIDVLNQIASFGGFSVALTGGETTLAKDWFEIAKYTKQLEMAMRFYTCGVYPRNKRDSILSKIIELNPTEIRVTYAGMQDTNDNVRIKKQSQKGTFSEITQTVEELMRNKQNIKLNYIFSHENGNEIEDFIRFVYNLSEKHSKAVPINIGPLRVYGSASIPHEFSFTAPDANDFYRINTLVGKLRKKLNMNITIVFDCLESLEEQTIHQKSEKIKNTPWVHLHQGCGLARAGLGIGYDGSVNVCGVMENTMLDNIVAIVEEEPKKYEPFGITSQSLRNNPYTNLMEHSAEDIWYGSPLLTFFQFFYKKEQCEPCEKYRIQCMGICPAMALRMSGDLRKGDKGCFKHLIQNE